MSSSITSDLGNNSEQNNDSHLFVDKSVVNTATKRKQLQRRKIINIAPIRLDELQKAVKDADAELTWEQMIYPQKKVEKENIEKHPEPPLQDSFDLNFEDLSLETPAKTKEVKLDKFVTPKPLEQKSNRALKFQYVTPNNKITPKVQCSVNIQTYRQTPLMMLRQVPECSEFEESNSTEKVQLGLIKDFKRLKVNDQNYIILNELGKGGSSEVFQCYNVEMKTHRAIKVVSLENASNAVGFINEVHLLQKLQNCNRIVRMYDFEIKQAEKILLVVLEVGDTDLSKILQESASSPNRQMPLYMLLYYWMEILHAVKQIHANRIIHSDLKPANFLKVGGYLKLIDFGIASSISNDSTSVIKTTTEGSFNYISPEALLGENSSNVNSPSYGKQKFKLNYKSDVWSMGCILYQLVYRRPPFHHIPQVWGKLTTIVNPNHKIDFPEVNGVPQKLINTMKQCLQWNMKLRPSVDELIEEYDTMFQNLS